MNQIFYAALALAGLGACNQVTAMSTIAHHEATAVQDKAI